MKRYNVTVSHQARLLWYRVAKVGTRTILSHLRDAPFKLDIEEGFSLTLDPRLQEAYYSFAFVRNPWERLVSCYADKVKGGGSWSGGGLKEKPKTFDAFVESVITQDLHTCDAHFRLQSALIDLNTVSFVGRYESFDRDLQKVLSNLSVPHEQPRARSVSGGGRIFRSYYTPTLVDHVASAYRRDIQIFGYSFE